MNTHFLFTWLISIIFAVTFIGGAIYTIKKNKLTQENYKLLLNSNKFIRIISAIALTLYMILFIIYPVKIEPITFKVYILDFINNFSFILSLWLSSECATVLYKRKMKSNS